MKILILFALLAFLVGCSEGSTPVYGISGIDRFETDEAICYKYNAGIGRGLSCKWKDSLK